MKKKKEKGPSNHRHQSKGPQRMAEAKRLFNSRLKELESPEATLFLKFAEIYPQADLTLHVAEGIWSFLQFLKERGYLIIHGEDLVCVPASKLVQLKDLK